MIETFREITIATLESLADKAAGLGHKITKSELRERVCAQLDQFIPAGHAPAKPADKLVTVHDQERVLATTGDGRHREVLGLDALLQEAVEANLQMTEKLVRGPGDDVLLARARCERQALSRLVQIAEVASDDETVHKITLSAVLGGTGFTLGSLMVGGDKGQPLREVAVLGRPRDPLNSIEVQGIGSAAVGLLDRRERLLCHDIPGELLFGQPHEAVEGLRSLLAVPFGRETGRPALLLIYATTRDRDIGADDAAFVELAGAISVLALRAASVPA